MSPLARLLRRAGLAALAAALLCSTAQAQQPQKTPAPAKPPAPIRVTYKLAGGVTIEERGNYPKEVGVRGPDGQMLIEFGLYHFIWTPPNLGGKFIEVRRQSIKPALPQELRGVYDFEQRRFAVPCDYSEYRPLGAVWLVTRRELKPKTPDKTIVGLYDPAAGRETFTDAIRVVETPNKLTILTSHKETAVFDAQGREVEPRRYTWLFYDAKLPLWLVQLTRGAKAPWGYIDAATGKAVTPVHYTRADPFAGGAARVMREGSYTFIDATGREPRPEGYAFLTPFRDGVAAFARQATVPESFFDRVRGTGWGFVTVKGEESATTYEDVGHDSQGPLLQEGRVLVKHGGRWLAVDPRLPQAEAVAAAVPPRWEPFQAPGQQATRPWGFRIPGGDTMLAPKWHFVQPFIGAYAPFGVTQTRAFENGKSKTKREVTVYGLIDATGREVLPPRFAQIKRLDDHLAVISDFHPSGYGSLSGLLDLRTLQVVVPPRYEQELMYAGEGSAALRAVLGRTYRLIDATGRELTPAYDDMSLFKEGLLRVKQNGYWFWLDHDLKPVHADKRYTKAEEFANGRALVWTGTVDQYGFHRGQALINYAGEVLQTFPDATAATAAAAQQSTAPRVVQCGVCNGSGKRFREVKVEYTGFAGSALRPYTPGGSYTPSTSGSYSKWEADGPCTACGGKGVTQPFKKK